MNTFMKRFYNPIDKKIAIFIINLAYTILKEEKIIWLY